MKFLTKVKGVKKPKVVIADSEEEVRDAYPNLNFEWIRRWYWWSFW